MKPEAVLPQRDELGEGPCWREATGELLWVDISNGRFHTWRPGDAAARTLSFDGDLGAVLPRAGGGVVLAHNRAIVLLDEDGTRHTVATVDGDRPGNRLNDCRCDPQGRLWAGTMAKAETPGAGSLYRLEHGGEPERVVQDVTISNGIGWSPDGTLMYYVDTPTQRVDVFDFDGATGEISGRRTHAETGTDGSPDGLAVDEEGGVWVGFFEGSAVRRFAPDGSLDEVVRLPASNVTCPAFGGPDRKTLYVTTARHGLSEAQRAKEELAGALFAFEPGVAGLPAHAFRG